ncbi:UBX domain protein Ubx2, partial [Coemansia asiatica]
MSEQQQQQQQSVAKRSPTDFLNLILGQRVFVRLNSGIDYKGVLACLDGYMNIAMEQTEEYVEGELRNRYGDVFIRGNNVSENNVEQAISLYFENGGQSLQGHGSSSSAPAPASGSAETAANPAPSGAEAANIGNFDYGDGVRAPIASRRDVLVDGFDSDMTSGYGAGYGSLYTGYSRDSSRNAARSIFNQGTMLGSAVAAAASSGPVPFRDFAQEAAEIAGDASASSAASSRRNRLAELFKPPFDIMYRGDFSSARQAARESGKWVLINVQDVTDFRCQALNRDIWRQQIIKDVVSKDFVFFQTSTETPEGARLATMYVAREFPFIAVVDPKTGEMKRTFERYENITDMVEDLANYALDNPAPTANMAATISDV